MIHGLADDIVRTRAHYGDAAFRDALRHAHPGIWDRRSWAYWHLVLDMGDLQPPWPHPGRSAPLRPRADPTVFRESPDIQASVNVRPRGHASISALRQWCLRLGQQFPAA